jgi:ABC-type fe3+-hydroxamate transport system, periplasmic component
MMKRYLNFTLIALSLGVLTACSGAKTSTNETKNETTTVANESKAETETKKAAESETKAAESTNSNENTATYPMVIKHAYGETKVEKKPERIVTIAWENNDTPLALGIVPVGVSAANFGKVTYNRLHAWADEAFKKLGVDKPNVFDDTAGLNFEEIGDAKPDIILASYSGISQEEYDTLSQIAPVIPYKEKPWQTLWRAQTIENATPLGLEKEAKKLVEDTEKLIKEKVDARPEIAGKTAAFVMISPEDLSKFFLYLPSDPRSAYLQDLGLSVPESVSKLAKENTEFYTTISRENSDMLKDVDILVTYGTSEQLAALQADEILSSIPAIKNGAVVFMDSTSDLAGGGTPSILSIPYNIDTYLDLISEAAKKVK